MAPRSRRDDSETTAESKAVAAPSFNGNICDNRDDSLYSTFSRGDKRLIVFLIAYAGAFSPLSSFIYYPAISSLARDLDTTVELINLTVTSYMIVSGVVPSLLGDIADNFGRRPVYLGALTVYFIANVGLAVQQSYYALLFLRMLQSAGSSGVISLAYAVVSDIATPAERGAYVGAVLLGPNVAPSLGPVLGGVLAEFAGWKWIFWVLVMMSGICLVVLLVKFPETARNIVGNGSIPPEGIHRLFPACLKFQKGAPENHLKSRRQFRLRSCLMPCFRIIFRLDNALIMSINGIFYMVYCALQASLSTLFIQIYGFKSVEAGLIYLPFGFGCALASYCSGYIMNREYRSVARSANSPVDGAGGDDLSSFPIEKARLRVTYVYMAIVAATTTGYGWLLDKKAHYAIVLVFQFFIGASITAIFNACGTLLVDVNPGRSATASAAANLIRCALAAGGLAVIDVIVAKLGPGWCFTLLTGISLMTAPMVYLLQRLGMGWRQKRAAKQEA